MKNKTILIFKILVATFFVLQLFSCDDTLNTETNSDGYIIVDNLKELSRLAAGDNQKIKLNPGVYTVNYKEFSDVYGFKLDTISETPADSVFFGAVLHFSGNGNKFDFTGTNIRISNKLLRSFGKNKVAEVLISGHDNHFEGLKVEDFGNIAPKNGCSAVTLYIMGDRDTVDHADLYVCGSSPYGYGYLLGKGANPIYHHEKHSSLLIAGIGTRLFNSKIVTHSYGHGIYLQGAVDTHIEGCYVEGKMRPTDEMLKETSGPAYSVDFRSVYPPGYIEKGKMIALSEDAYRAYPKGANGRCTKDIVIKNCVAKHMRAAFSFSLAYGDKPTIVEDCTEIECQSGFGVPNNGVIVGCKGDAAYGPVISFPYKKTHDCTIELTLIPTTSDFPPTRLIEVNGSNHEITIYGEPGDIQKKQIPICFGESSRADLAKFDDPTMDMRDASGASNVHLVNKTGMPIILNERTKNCTIESNGEVTDQGEGDIITKL